MTLNYYQYFVLLSSEYWDAKRFVYAAIKVLFFASFFFDLCSAIDSIMPSIYKSQFNLTWNVHLHAADIDIHADIMLIVITESRHFAISPADSMLSAQTLHTGISFSSQGICCKHRGSTQCLRDNTLSPTKFAAWWVVISHTPTNYTIPQTRMKSGESFLCCWTNCLELFPWVPKISRIHF